MIISNQSLCVDKPEIKEVFEIEAGELFTPSKVKSQLESWLLNWIPDVSGMTVER